MNGAGQVLPEGMGEPSPPPADPVTPEEQALVRQQLMAFKASFDNGAEALPYFTGEGDPCTWYPTPQPLANPHGVICTNDGRVTRM